MDDPKKPPPRIEPTAPPSRFAALAKGVTKLAKKAPELARIGREIADVLAPDSERARLVLEKVGLGARTINLLLPSLEGILEPAALERLASGEVRIDQETLRRAIAAECREVATLAECECTPDGIRIAFRGVKLGGRLIYSARFRVESLVVDSAHQTLLLRVEDERLAGESLIGHVIAAIARLFVKSLFSSVSQGALAERLEIVPAGEPGQFQIALDQLPVIARLRAPGAGGLVPLDFLHVERCVHEPAALVVQCGLGKSSASVPIA